MPLGSHSVGSWCVAEIFGRKGMGARGNGQFKIVSNALEHLWSHSVLGLS